MTKRKVSPRKKALAAGYRSGLEDAVQTDLKQRKIKFTYESIKIEWEDLMYRKYTPDFILPNNVIVETKGRFTAGDRKKHIKIKAQHPNLDIRILFEKGNRPLYKGAKSTYGDWCDKHGFTWDEGKEIPQSWVDHPKAPLPDAKLIPFPNKKKD